LQSTLRLLKSQEGLAREALRYSVRKAEIAGVVLVGKTTEKPNMFQALIGHKTPERISHVQVDGSIQTAYLSSEDRDVSLQGEYFTWRMLKGILGDDFRRSNWTSELRQFAGSMFTAWQPSSDQEDASDVTYFDKDETLLK